MSEMKKKIIAAIFIFILVNLLLVIVLGHQGSTDFRGGHYDRSTGEYHYHHGYSAHDHYDMDGDGIIDCPYNFDDKTDHDNHNSNSNDNSNSYCESDDGVIIYTHPKKLSFGDVISIVFQIIVYSIINFIVVMITLILPLICGGVNLLIAYICKKIFKTDIEESTSNQISLISLIVGVLIIILIVSICVLKDYDIL